MILQAVVTLNNFQMYRHIMSPGWTMGWTWAKKEVLWSMEGSQTTEQGDCSKFKGNIPHCCKKTPTVVDLLPGVPYNQQFTNCCKGGVVAAWGQDPQAAVSAFQLSVGQAGTSNKTVKLPKNFTLLGPGPGYTCGPAKIVPSTTFLTPDRRRKTQALSKIMSIAIFFHLHFNHEVQTVIWLSFLSFVQWLGMWPALTHSFWPERTQIVVFLSHLSTTIQSHLVRLAPVVAKTRTAASSKAISFSFL